ncbi:endolytic transglycosylase MltG [Cytobacillus solani]|nr:endolytic transglycosylase MltG [Cytobacillus solani]USK55956.1 endolytic transglycosylase MltG [Cytobacillus solani]
MMEMKAEKMRSFAAGLMIAAGLCGAVYYLGSDETTTATENKTVTSKMSEDEMISLLASKGFVVHTEEEWNKQLAAEKEAEKKPNEEKVVYRTVLTVTLGMTSIDVGKALEKAHIIKSAKEFFNEVEKRGVSTKLRPGSYDLESGMTEDQIIKTIFK